jgi:hypothetical protein
MLGAYETDSGYSLELLYPGKMSAKVKLFHVQIMLQIYNVQIYKERRLKPVFHNTHKNLTAWQDVFALLVPS